MDRYVVQFGSRIYGSTLCIMNKEVIEGLLSLRLESGKFDKST